MTPDPARRVEADARLTKALSREHQIGRDDTILKNLLVVINIIDKQIEGTDPLFQTYLQVLPFLRLNDSRNNIKRENLFSLIVITIDVKGDSQIQ